MAPGDRPSDHTDPQPGGDHGYASPYPRRVDQLRLMTAFMNEQSGRRVMTGERAVELVNLLAEYVRDSIREGAELQEVVDWTIGDVVEDTVMTTPQSLRERLDVLALELYG